MTETTAARQSEAEAEIARLRARVDALERELLEQAERTHRVLAEAQQRTYWLDRWHLDLDVLARHRRLAAIGDLAFRAARKLVRGARRVGLAPTRRP